MKNTLTLILLFITLVTISFNILFNGYPSEAVSIFAGLVCLAIGLFVVGRELLDEKNYR